MKTKKIVLYSLLIALSLIIFFFSSQEGRKSESVSDSFASKIVDNYSKVTNTKVSQTDKKKFITNTRFIIRKCAHFSLYFALGIIIYLLVRTYQVKYPFRLTIIICLVFACGDEIHQLFIKGRTSRIYDVVIDTFGSSIGIFMTYLIESILKKLKRKKVSR